MHNLNIILAPLYDLLKDKQPLLWTSTCQIAFDKLKLVSSPPVLHSPSKGDIFVLESDASDVGVGCCLKAINKHGEFIVGYCSKKFVNSEIRWNIVEKSLPSGAKVYHFLG